jgi:hypothetical protein
MELANNCKILIAQVEVENISLTLGLPKSDIIQNMLVQVGSMLRSLKPKLKNQKSYHKTFYISNEDSYYKLKAVFHTRWWRHEDKNSIAQILISSPRGVTRKYTFLPQDIDKSLTVSLEKSIFGE